MRTALTGAPRLRGISRRALHACVFLPPPFSLNAALLAGRDRQRPDPPEHRPEQASGQMTLRQQQPVVPRVFHQAPAGLDEAQLHTGQRPAVDALRQHQSSTQIPKVVGQHAQLQLDLVRLEPVTGQPGPMRPYYPKIRPSLFVLSDADLGPDLLDRVRTLVRDLLARISDLAVVPYSLDHSSRPDSHGSRREEPRHGG
jgi:hypothetical protein